MKKTFKLPKEFTEKWIASLLSDKYEQTTSTLVDIDGETKECSYCCLGVAGLVAGYDHNRLGGFDLLNDFESENPSATELIPLELLRYQDRGTMVDVLVSLNDGVRLRKYKEIAAFFPDLIFKKIPKGNGSTDEIRYNFKEIAEFIKINTELI